MSLAHVQLDIPLRDRILFGRGRIAELPGLVRELGGKRAFVVTDAGVARVGVADQVRTVLEAARIGVHVHAEVEPNPGTASIVRGSHALALFGTSQTVVVALGGGSSMDAAKAISLHATNGGNVLALGYHREDLAPGVPIVAVPTTAGTGAEVNTYGVITDEAAGRKGYVGHPSVQPRAAILDPQLTVGLPPAVTAATGVDAMTHSLESLLSRNPNPFAEAMALQVIRTVTTWLPSAVRDGGDMEARAQLLLASHLAGIGQASGTGVGLVHAIGHALGTRGRLPHGTALAAVLPEVLAFYADRPGLRDRELALVGVAIGAAAPDDDWADAARAAIEALDAFLRAVDQRPTLAQLGVGPELIPVIAQDAIDDPAINNSPRLPDVSEVEALLHAVAG
ncbi:MAG TPA: iron-containing alcohol dehydrogenase [Candidatus Limnocylindrales bacterium]|nr:iron-containing alcohol dehydrogenase [Candidatus Limnocylindrales bacterium]